ncbi:uncharacterized protein PV09_06640 [Verruconis gallopava]|uniref:AA9 family lytic polysaccharide monooxygenase n=1 Tax=Verruconis gallopava TaxID=253628 RepID=A0A0D1XIK4_9PEZI|nr:uncharacterized protein PV09_06640 [Verruconis gallopava]KIW02156.1 hypothetical protein PV09_06640 [Verruconis gallopava]
MQAFLILSYVVATLLNAVRAHYVFSKIKVNGIESEEYEVIRRNTNGESPITDLEDPELRCNVGASNKVNGTKTVIVESGSNITWVTETYIYHPGPLSVFMTRVDNASTADGSTEWFKILDIGPKFTKRGGDWRHIQQSEFNVTVPPCLATGQYLMRIQHIAIHVPGGEPQFHVACAQMMVIGTGVDMPPKAYMVRIPEVFTRDHPGFNQNIFVNFKEYLIPGGNVWKC